LRLTIDLQPVSPYVRLRHHRYPDAKACTDAIVELADPDGPLDFLDGTVFDAGEQYLTTGEFVDALPTGTSASDYTGQKIFYRSQQERAVDHLTIRDYIWRWDTDWFWCSRAFGVQHRLPRLLLGRRFLRSSVYWKAVALDRRFKIAQRLLKLRRLPPEETIVQDIEVPVGRAAEFLEFFEREIPISPVWVCPLRQRPGGVRWPLYELDPKALYVNFGFWSAVPLDPGERDGVHNRMIESEVTRLGGHKSLYSDSFYAEDEFWRLYNGDTYRELKRTYDPAGRLLGLYEKCVRRR
jgi:FAD/FMN-containing dehydrogenase